MPFPLFLQKIPKFTFQLRGAVIGGSQAAAEAEILKGVPRQDVVAENSFRRKFEVKAQVPDAQPIESFPSAVDATKAPGIGAVEKLFRPQIPQFSKDRYLLKGFQSTHFRHTSLAKIHLHGKKLGGIFEK
jgi:hypothetical protein